jgi:hypothetical protein
MSDPFENFQNLKRLSDEKLKSLASQFGHDAGTIKQVVLRMRDLWDLQLGNIEVEQGGRQSKASTARMTYLDEKYLASIAEYSDLVEISIRKRVLFETSHLLLKARQSERRYHNLDRRPSPSSQKTRTPSKPTRVSNVDSKS